MSMSAKFSVHRASSHLHAARVMHDGETITAQIPALEVELSPVGGMHGSMMLRFSGQNAELAAETFQQDAIVTVTFDAAPAQ